MTNFKLKKYKESYLAPDIRGVRKHIVCNTVLIERRSNYGNYN